MSLLTVNLNPAPPLLDFGLIVERVCGEDLLKLDFQRYKKTVRKFPYSLYSVR